VPAVAGHQLLIAEGLCRRQTAHEEVLTAALRQCRRSILLLEKLEKDVAAALERENKQFERLHFALQKAMQLFPQD
jgi:hypothetical protein